jgi:hypothetical protein
VKPFTLFPLPPRETALKLRTILYLSLLFSCDSTEEVQTFDKGTPQILDLAEASIYRAQAGQTLSEIALVCDIPGGAETLAAWNGLLNPDRIEAGAPLRMPPETECDVELVPALLPRFEDDWELCTAQWSELDQRGNDSIYAHLSGAELDRLDGNAFDNYYAGERWCAEPETGLKICWWPHQSPGLQIHWNDELVYQDDSPSGRGGAGGGIPTFTWLDLDADGDMEFILTQLTTWSMGISYAWTRVLVFEDTDTPPVEQNTVYYESKNWLVNPAGGCDLLHAQNMVLRDPVRGGGNYLGGLRLQWTGTALELADFDVFPAQRITRDFIGRMYRETPLDWLLDGTADAHPREHAVYR